MSPVDETMRALLAVHRDELDQRDQQIADLTYQAQDGESYRRNFKNERERAADLTKTVKGLRSEIQVANGKITKLEGVIESLKIELADAREQATKAREGVTINVTDSGGLMSR